MGIIWQVYTIVWKDVWVQKVKRHYLLTAAEIVLVALSFLTVERDRPLLRPKICKNGSKCLRLEDPLEYPERSMNDFRKPQVIMFSPDVDYNMNLMAGAFPSEPPILKGYKNASAMLKAFRETSPVPKRGPEQRILASYLRPPVKESPHDLHFSAGFYDDLAYLSRRRKDYGTFNPIPNAMTQRETIAYFQVALFHEHLRRVRQEKKSTERLYNISTRRLPQGPYPQDVPSKRSLMVLRLGFGFMIPFCILVFKMVDETQSGMREKLRVCGLRDGVYWLGHFLAAMLIGVVSCVIVIIYMAAFEYEKNRVKHHFLDDTDKLAVLLAFVVFSAQYITIAMCLSLFFTDSTAAVVVAVCLWNTSYIVPWFVLEDRLGRSAHYILLGRWTKLFSSLLPCMGLHWCFRIIGCANLVGEPYGFLSVLSPVIQLDNVAMAEIWLVMILESALMCVLIWYLGNVLSWAIGVPLVPWFPFTARYWFPGRQGTFTQFPPKIPDGVHFEAYPKDLEAAVFVNRLEFERKQEHILRDTNFQAYKGEILTLLGSSGSGKTTLVDIMCGMIVPSGGQVIVLGYDMIQQTKIARVEMSVVQSDDILFGDLTVLEHLVFFGAIGAMSGERLRQRVIEIEDMFQLAELANVLAWRLDKAQKRRLDLAIAITTNPKVLILDEPVRGMDLQSRAAVWDVLSSIKKTTCIITTTTDVEDVEAMSDRIAILGFGAVKCYGSINFLRWRYGSGYNVRVQKGPKFQTSKTVAQISQTVPGTHVLQDHKEFVILSLGERNGYAPIAAVFSMFETERDRLGIVSFTVSVITMEDIFLRVTLELDVGDVESKRRALMNKKEKEKLRGTTGVEQIEYSEDVMMIATENIGGVTKMEEYYESSVKVEAHVKTLYDLKPGEHGSFQIFLALLAKRRYYTRNALALPLLCWLLPVALLFVLCWLETTSLHRTAVSFSADSLIYDIPFVHPASSVFVNQDDASGDVANSYNQFMRAQGNEIHEIRNLQDYLKELLSKRARELEHLHGAQFTADTTAATSEGKAVAWYDGGTYHTQSLSINAISTVLLRRMSNNPTAKVVTVYKPLRSDARLDSSESIYSANVSRDLSEMITTRVFRFLFIPMATSVTIASFVLFPIDDRASNSKKMQLISGVPTLLYWFANYVFDMLMMAMSYMFMLVPIIYCHPGFIQHVPLVFIIILAYAHSSLPFVYLFSFVTNSLTVGFLLVNAVVAFVGIASTMGYQLYIMEKEAAMSILSLDHALDPMLSWLFFLPPFSFNWALVKIFQLALENLYCAGHSTSQLNDICAYIENSPDQTAILMTGLRYCCASFLARGERHSFHTLNAFTLHRDSVFFELVAMFAEGIVMLILLGLIEYGAIRTIWRSSRLGASAPQEFSQDVLEERKFVEKLVFTGELSNSALLVSDLQKSIKSRPLLRGLSFHMKPGECFVIMGLKGCGKSTLLDILSGVVEPSGGTAFAGRVPLESIGLWQQKIGLCPSYDGILGRLTVWQSLELYACIRGIQYNHLDKLLNNIIDLLNLRVVAHDTVDSCGAIVRRQLAVAISIIGLPPLVLMDDPATGLDLIAKRKIYRTIVLIRQLVKAAVLVVTHSMSDCIVMSDRMAIMLNGQFQCLGTVNDLRSRLCRGYVLVVKLRPDVMRTPETFRAINEIVRRSFPKMTYNGRLGNNLDFSVEVVRPWSELVKVVYELRTQLQAYAQDVILGETTLEHALLKIAKYQKPRKYTVVA